MTTTNNRQMFYQKNRFEPLAQIKAQVDTNYMKMLYIKEYINQN